MLNRYGIQRGRSLRWVAALLCAFLSVAPGHRVAAAAEVFVLSGEAVYLREVLDSAQSGPTYSPKESLSPNRATPRYDALILQQVPGGEPTDIADCRRFPELGPKLGQLEIDASGRYVAVTSYIPLGRVIRRGPALFVYDRKLKSLLKITNCVYSFFWSPSGSRCLISDDFGSGAHFDIYDAALKKTTMLFLGARNAPDTAWTNGGRSVAYTNQAGASVETNLETGRTVTRWLHSAPILPDPSSHGYDASPYSRSAIASEFKGDRPVDFGVTLPGRRLVKIELWTLDQPGLLWSPDGKLLAVHRWYYPEYGGEPNDAMPTSTSQDIAIFNCASWKRPQEALSWDDQVLSPYRYHLVGWCGGHRWLLLLDDGVYHDPGITSERLVAYDTHTEKFGPILLIDSWISAADWHADD